jgi:hypothetical protein
MRAVDARPPLVEVEDLGDVGERPQQALGHEDEHGVQPHLELAVEHGPAADEQRAGEPREDRHANQRHEGRRGADRPHVGLAVGARVALDPPTFAVLGGEGLDRGDPGEVCAQGPGEVGHRLPHPGVQRLEAALEHERAEHDERDRQEGHDEQGQRRRREDRTDEDDVERGLQDRGQPDVEQALELVDVVVEGRDRRAGRPGLVPREVEVLRVVVGLHPQVVLHSLGQPRQSTAATYSEPDSIIQTTTLIAASHASWAYRDSTPSTSAAHEFCPRMTTSTAAPMSSSGTTSATLLTTEAMTAAMKRTR